MPRTTGPASNAELAALHRAVELAAFGAGTVLPNPVVGCVLLASDGTVVGEGFHDRPGGPHAEVAALAVAGARARGATAVVTLEPCDHAGRTGPCSRALIDAGVQRVIVPVRDPWPPAAGGADTLRDAGVDVVEMTGSLRDVDAAAVDACEDINRVWLGAIRRNRPFVTWKTGMTIDGRVAAVDGTSRWITSAQSRADVHRLRSRVDTIMVGIGTVLADDPALTARDPDGTLLGRQPLRVVLDSHGRTPPGARVVDGSAETLVATVDRFGSVAGRVDVAAVLNELYRGHRRHVLLEGGPTVAAAAFDARLIDEALVYLAPSVLGGGRSAVDGGTVATLTAAHRLELREVTRLGPDVGLRYSVLH